VKLPGDGLERLGDCLCGIGDGLEVGVSLPSSQMTSTFAVTLGFEHPGGADAVEIAVEIKFEQGGRVVRRTPVLAQRLW